MRHITNAAGEEAPLYTTSAEFVQREVVEPLEAGHLEGETAYDDFDVDAIVGEVMAFHDGLDEDGNQDLARTGYYQDVDSDTFWKIAEKHATPAQP